MALDVGKLMPLFRDTEPARNDDMCQLALPPPSWVTVTYADSSQRHLLLGPGCGYIEQPEGTRARKAPTEFWTMIASARRTVTPAASAAWSP